MNRIQRWYQEEKKKLNGMSKKEKAAYLWSMPPLNTITVQWSGFLLPRISWSGWKPGPGP